MSATSSGPLERCSANMEELLQACVCLVDENFNKDIEVLLSYIQIQFSTIASIEKAVETVTEASMPILGSKPARA